MTFLRRKWQQKPKQWGPFSVVQSALFYNAEKMRIDPHSIEYATPLWNPGNQVDYSKNSFPLTAALPEYGFNFEKNYIKSSATVRGCAIGSTPGLSGGLQFEGTDPFALLCWIDYKSYIDSSSTGWLFGNSTSQVLRKTDNKAEFILNDFSSNDRVSSVSSMPSNGVGLFGGFYREGSNELGAVLGNEINTVTPVGTYSNTTSSSFTLFGREYNNTLSAAPNVEVHQVLVIRQDFNDDQIASLSDNPYQLWQPVHRPTYFLPLSSNFPINSILQSQPIDNLDLIQHNLLSINPINQPQTISNIDLIISIKLIIDKMIQNQSLENIPLLQHNILTIGKLEQLQAIKNIDLVITGVLAIAPIIQSQSIETIIIIQHNNLVMDGIDQAQELEQIVLDTGILLQISRMIQNQSIDSLDLTQAHILEIDELLQGQAIDKIILSIIGERIVITLTLKSPGIDLSLSSPGIDLEIE